MASVSNRRTGKAVQEAVLGAEDVSWADDGGVGEGIQHLFLAFSLETRVSQEQLMTR